MSTVFFQLHSASMLGFSKSKVPHQVHSEAAKNFFRHKIWLPLKNLEDRSNMAISTIIGARLGRKQTERFACKCHASWASLEPHSAGNQLSFPGSKLLIDSPY